MFTSTEPTRTEHYEDPFICKNITGWYKLGSSCYGFFENQTLTWLDAQAECRKHGADLLTYRSSAVPMFIKRKLKLKNGYIWIGARESVRYGCLLFQCLEFVSNTNLVSVLLLIVYSLLLWISSEWNMKYIYRSINGRFLSHCGPTTHFNKIITQRALGYPN